MYAGSLMSYHHRSKHSKERPFCCDVCSKRFYSKNELKIHKIGVHANSVKCPQCSKVLKNKFTLRTHLKYHSDMRFPCTYVDNGVPCNKGYISMHLLQQHVDTIHLKKKRLNCPINTCTSKFNLKSDLNTHLFTFHERKKIKCDFCSTTVSSKEYYCRHIRSHHSEMNMFSKEDFVKKILKTSLEDLYNFQIDAKEFKGRAGKVVSS